MPRWQVSKERRTVVSAQAQSCSSSKHFYSLYCPALINPVSPKDGYLILSKNLTVKAEVPTRCHGHRRWSLKRQPLPQSFALGGTMLELLCQGDPARGVLPRLSAFSRMVGTVLCMCSCANRHIKAPHGTGLSRSGSRSSLTSHQPTEQALYAIITVFLWGGGQLRTTVKGRGVSGSPIQPAEDPGTPLSLEERIPNWESLLPWPWLL